MKKSKKCNLSGFIPWHSFCYISTIVHLLREEGSGITLQICSFTAPTKIISGVDARKTVGTEVKSLGGKVVFISTDKGIVNAGLLVDILESLSKESLAYVVFDEVETNPAIDIVEKGLQVYRNEECDILLAVGGGSAMDTAKAIGIMVNNPGPIGTYAGIDKYPCAPPDIVSVPTAAGTGAEILSTAVITDPVRNCKISVSGARQSPRVAIVDPLMLQTLPASIAAATGMVTLTHAVEGYVSLGSSELTDLLNFKGIQLAAKYLRRFVANRRDLEAATGMQMACLYAALGSSNSGLGNVYAMANSLDGHFNILHGIACAVLLPAVMEFNTMACPDKFIEIAGCFGENVSGLPAPEASLKAAVAVRKLVKDIGLPAGLREMEITEKQIVQMSRDAIGSGIYKTNPRETNLMDMIKLYRESI